MKKFYLTFFLLTLISTSVFAQIFVTEAGAGNKDGTSWLHAYDNTQLQLAINTAESAPVKQVWVAKGTYKPTESLSSTGFLTDGTTPVTARDNAFILKTAVEIYGGFAGGEGAIIDRVNISTTNETILSGDLNNNDTADDGDSYHVVSSRNASLGAILDGFTIQHGFANGIGDITEGGEVINQNWGGAVCLRGDQTGTNFSNLLIKNNKSTAFSGGIYARGSDGFSFTKVSFLDNEGGGSGGGLYMYTTTDVTINISDCIFNGNSGAGDGGGGLYSGGATANPVVNITNTTFLNNIHDLYGGALRFNAGTGNVTNCTFMGNSSTRGAVYSTGSSTLNFDQCTFDGNTSTNNGGQYYIFNGAGDIKNTTFKNGSSTTTGGAIYVNSGSLTILSTTFDTNASTTAGGAIYNGSGTIKATSSIFKNNTSTTNGGAIYNSSGTLEFISCEFSSNTSNGTTGGGAIYTSNGPVSISKSKFFSNTSGAGGGAIYFTGAFIYSINNSLFYNNAAKTTSGNTGATIYNSTVGSELTITNSTFYANKAVITVGAAVSFNSTANVKINLYNNIFDSNLAGYDFDTQTGGSFADIRSANSANQIYSNNIMQSSLTTSGNRTVTNTYTLGANPLFASTTPTDYNFLWPVQGGFSLDKGDNALYTTNVSDVNTAKDLLGNDRLVNSGTANIDLGAIEWSTVLPVTVSSFTGNLANNRTQLKWSVGTEQNVNRYEIERSSGSADFVKVAEVPATGSSSYATIDANPQLGDNYYRLKTVDNDGTYSYYGQLLNFKVASLGTEEVKVYPNPVKSGNVSVSLSGYPVGTYTYKLINASGSVVQQGVLSNSGSSASLALLPSISKGVYVLQLDNGASVKLVKQ